MIFSNYGVLFFILTDTLVPHQQLLFPACDLETKVNDFNKSPKISVKLNELCPTSAVNNHLSTGSVQVQSSVFQAQDFKVITGFTSQWGLEGKWVLKYSPNKSFLWAMKSITNADKLSYQKMFEKPKIKVL